MHPRLLIEYIWSLEAMDPACRRVELIVNRAKGSIRKIGEFYIAAGWMS